MKSSFLLHTIHYSSIKGFSLEQKGMLLDAIYQYHISGKTPELPDVLNVAFSFIRSQFEYDNLKYEAICDRNKSNGSKGGRPRKNPDEPKKPTGIIAENQYSENPENPKNPLGAKKPDNDNENDNVNDKRKKQVFSPPSLSEVIEKFKKEISERGKNLNPEFEAEKFIAHYDSINWQVGKNKMTKWKSAVTGWVLRSNDSYKPTNGQTKPSGYKPPKPEHEYE
jgi:hypothetical protein